MNWQQLMHELMDSGLSQTKIAELLGTTQATVSRIASGSVKAVYWDMGNKILNLVKTIKEQ